ncbi:MAG: DUF1343 domain-containing protein [Pseudomonadota bacterium]
MKVQLGLERLVTEPDFIKLLNNKRLGLLANPASVDSNLRHSRDVIASAFPGRLAALFAPQHGFLAEKQDNMIESSDDSDPLLNIPVFSLYGPRQSPTKDMLDLIDALIIDIQDVGTRVYTFASTMALCLKAARESGREVFVLDRPNPISGLQVEGNCLDPEYVSFVGMYPIPMRHGLTIGELALLFNKHFKINAQLTIVPMKGWERAMCFEDTELTWVIPSPNLPSPNSAIVYPGQVIWEGTNVSEGRGATLPFELFGAPFLSAAFLKKISGDMELPGARLRIAGFEPTSNKWQGSLCRGFQIHVTDRTAFKPYRTSLSLLQAIVTACQGDFAWKQPPYEYEHEKLPIDIILGSRAVRDAIEAGEKIEDIESGWAEGVDEFCKLREEYLLYR